MTPEERERDRRTAWKAAQTACGALWPTLLDDLTQEARSASDPVVRCGRQDMIVYILDSLIGTQEEA